MIQMFVILGLLVLALGVVFQLVRWTAQRLTAPTVTLPRPGERWCLRQGADERWREYPAPCATILTVRRGLVWYRPDNDLRRDLEYRTVAAFCQLYARRDPAPEASPRPASQ